jgi:hypothetical protein
MKFKLLIIILLFILNTINVPYYRLLAVDEVNGQQTEPDSITKLKEPLVTEGYSGYFTVTK